MLRCILYGCVLLICRMILEWSIQLRKKKCMSIQEYMEYQKYRRAKSIMQSTQQEVLKILLPKLMGKYHSLYICHDVYSRGYIYNQIWPKYLIFFNCTTIFLTQLPKQCSEIHTILLILISCSSMSHGSEKFIFSLWTYRSTVHACFLLQYWSLMWLLPSLY